MIDKNFTPKSFESSLYDENAFACTPNSDKKAYCIMMPPPNVTGSLHLGHALTYTLPDILVRFQRMCGFDVLWQPGTDHAGIATQMVVEKQLDKQKITRYDLGREQFLQKVWQWKEESGNTIVQQQKRLRITPDWQRQRFTMDEGLSRAVTKVFVDLYNQGLIYRDKRLVNWDTILQTAVSDLEVISKEEKGSLWYLAYEVVNHKEKIIIATTRPETIFADTAIAIHPSDERYQHLIGQQAIIPLTDRSIPIIADEYCDPTKGSGTVKITPAHDFNDFMVGQRHNLPLINILNADGTFNDQTPNDYHNLSVNQARAKILADLQETGVLIKEENIVHFKPLSDRSGVEIQPWLTEQWFVDAKTLAGPAIQAVKDGKTKFFPQMWENTYFEWLENIQPWCISRQIWWGHQIPAWFGPDKKIFVANSEAEAIQQAKEYYNTEVELIRDPDVLDTWFSSALWPFTTLGWPEQTPELAKYYPTDVMITGFDIIFFWVARMMMMGIHFMGDVPFRDVYIHALVRDEQGQKMSKSKGNIIDPLDLLDKFGADAVRFTLAILSSPGRDVKIGESKVEANRNFITKIWNAARFLQMHEAKLTEFRIPNHPINRWLVVEVTALAKKVEHELLEYRFDLAAQSIYQIIWGKFCDVYLEAIKPLIQDPNFKDETIAVALWGLMELLKISYPFIPMIADYLWQQWHSQPIITEKWSVFNSAEITGLADDHNKVDELLMIVTEIRSIKGLLGLSGGIILPLSIYSDYKTAKKFESLVTALCAMGRVKDVNFISDPLSNNKGTVPIVFKESILYLHLQEVMEHQQIVSLLQQKQQLIITESERLQNKLKNQAYKEAKPEQWQNDQQLLVEKVQEISNLKKIIEKI